MKIRQKNKSGFSLVEVLVAVSILLLVVATPMQIISRSMNSTSFAGEQVIAWFIAQEGLELAQKGRDDLLLMHFSNPTANASPISSFLTTYNTCFSTTGCGLSINNNPNADVTVTNCSTIANCRIRQDTSNDRSKYQYGGTGLLTPYTRVIKMQRFPASGDVKEIKVTSTVTWRTGSIVSSQTVEAVTYLFNVHDKN